MVVEKEDTVELRVDRKACVRKTLAATNLMADGGGENFQYGASIIHPTVSNF